MTWKNLTRKNLWMDFLNNMQDQILDLQDRLKQAQAQAANLREYL